MTQTIAQFAVESLIANGIENLYCVPGVQNDPFFNALYDRQQALKPVHARHEQGAVYMALGAALATGKPQAFCIVPGPGFLNGCAALCTAYSLNMPLFGLIGQIPSRAIGKHLGLLHETEGQLETLATMTKYSARVTDGAAAAARFHEAWTALLSGRPRPVGLEIPVDSWGQEVTTSDTAFTVKPQPRPAIKQEQVDAAIQLIESARHPLIVVGGGAHDSAAEVRKLAPNIGAGVIAFRTGHGVMDDNHPLSLNMPTAHALWGECDLVIGLGTRLTTQKLDWGVDDNLKILHVDLDPEVPQRIAPATVAVQADLAEFLPALNLHFAEHRCERESWLSTIAEAKGEISARIAEELSPQLGWLNAIREMLPDDGLFVDELTQIGYVSRFAFPASQPRTFLSTGYQGTLGWGIASAIGAAHARPDVPVVSIAGDGGALFTITELATAAHHKIPVNIIVMNDNAFGNVKGIQRDNYDARYIASDLTSPDFVKLAESFGISACQVNSPDELKTELGKAIANPAPNLIEVPVGEFPSPWKYILMKKVRGA